MLLELPKLSDQMRNGEFLVSVQLDPPGSSKISEFRNTVELIINAGAKLFDINSSRRVSHDSIMLACEFGRFGLNTIPHVTLRDSALSGITNQMLAAYSWAGVRSFLLIAGDPHDEERAMFPSRGIFQANVTEAIKILDKHLRQNGVAINIEFAAAFNQNETDIGAEINRAKEKILAGADFFMSQPVFSLTQATKLYGFRPSDDIPIVAGVWPLVSKKIIEKIWSGGVVGVYLPERIYKEATTIDDQEIEKWGIAKARDLVLRIKDSALFHGVYIVAPFKNPRLILPLIQEFC